MEGGGQAARTRPHVAAAGRGKLAKWGGKGWPQTIQAGRHHALPGPLSILMASGSGAMGCDP